MDSLGVDVARGGRDSTILARRHGMWFDVPIVHPGTATPDGPTVAELTVAALRDYAVVHLDVIGVGASPYDFLRELRDLQVRGINVSEAATGLDQSGRIRFRNLRSQLWWRMREALDPANNLGVSLPPDPRLLADLCAPTWKLSGAMIHVASREEIAAAIGRSPDFGSAYCLGLIHTPKRYDRLNEFRTPKRRRRYDPFSKDRERERHAARSAFEPGGDYHPFKRP